MSKRLIYTIGYAGRSISNFLDTLKKFGINLVVDVRSNPTSAYWTDYDDVNLKPTLLAASIHYRSFSLEFGARQTNPEYLSEKGFVSFQRFSHSEPFQRGMRRIQKGIDSGYRVVLMCAEKDPSRCHRSILVAKAFHEIGFDVVHILSTGEEMTQTELEQSILDEYFPHRRQLSLTGRELNDAQMLEAAYLKRNEEIGFRTGDELK